MNKNIEIEIFSFGFKYYIDGPPECDLRVDLRGKIKNPQSHLPKGAIGKDKIVINTILDSSKNKKYIENLFKRVKNRLSTFEKTNFKIGIGCKSGIHRSVVVTDELAKKLENLGYSVVVSHVNLKVD